MGYHLANPTTFDAMGEEWHILELPPPNQPRAPAQTPVWIKKCKAGEPHTGRAHARPHAQTEAQDTTHAQALAPQAPERGDITAFLIEALSTAQGNEELRQILDKHEHVALNANAK